MTIELPDQRPTQIRLVGRELHPWSWWLWAAGIAVGIFQTLNLGQLLVIDLAMVFVVVSRRTTSAWARALKLYLTMGAIVIVVRLFFAVFFSARPSGTPVFRLPEITLPDWLAGIRIGGIVTQETLIWALCDAVRLASLIICFGAAVSLANPRRALKTMPAALNQLTVVVIVGLTVAPQLIESVRRIRRAQRLRGDREPGLKGFVQIVIPVLEDAVSHSLSLAAAMESRGFGRRDPRRVSRLAPFTIAVTILALPLGVFLFLSQPVVAHQTEVSVVCIVIGVAAGVFGVMLSGRAVNVSRYRPDPWRWPEWAAVASGLLAGACVVWLAQRDPGLMSEQGHALVLGVSPLFALPALAIALAGIVTPAPPGLKQLRAYSGVDAGETDMAAAHRRLRGRESDARRDH